MTPVTIRIFIIAIDLKFNWASQIRRSHPAPLTDLLKVHRQTDLPAQATSTATQKGLIADANQNARGENCVVSLRTRLTNSRGLDLAKQINWRICLASSWETPRCCSIFLAFKLRFRRRAITTSTIKSSAASTRSARQYLCLRLCRLLQLVIFNQIRSDWTFAPVRSLLDRSDTSIGSSSTTNSWVSVSSSTDSFGTAGSGIGSSGISVRFSHLGLWLC